MKQGFIKAAAVTPKIKVADPKYNGKLICRLIDEAVKEQAKVIVFPELCLTGYSCGDLFLQELLLTKAKKLCRKWRRIRGRRTVWCLWGCR